MPDATPIAVSAGFGWTAAGAWGSFLVLVGLVVRQVIPWRKISVTRIAHLERIMDRERAVWEAERRIFGHEIANLTHIVDMMIELIEMSPDRAPEIVKRIKDIQARQALEIAAEKGALHAAKIHAEDPVSE